MADHSKPIQDWKCMKCGHEIHISRQKARFFDAETCNKCDGPIMPSKQRKGLLDYIPSPFDGESIEKPRMPAEGLKVYLEAQEKANIECERRHHSNKRWDFNIDSEDTVPRIFKQGKELTLADRYGIVDFRMHWHTRESMDEGNEHQWEVLMFDPSEESFVKVFRRFAGDHETLSRVIPNDIQTCEDALKYIESKKDQGKRLGELKIKMTLDGSDAIHGLKAVQREIRNTVQQFKELDKVKADIMKVGGNDRDSSNQSADV